MSGPRPRTPDAWRDLAAEDLATEAAVDLADAAAIAAAVADGWTVEESGRWAVLRHPDRGELYRVGLGAWRWVPPGRVFPAASFARLAVALEYAGGEPQP